MCQSCLPGLEFRSAARATVPQCDMTQPAPCAALLLPTCRTQLGRESQHCRRYQHCLGTTPAHCCCRVLPPPPPSPQQPQPSQAWVFPRACPWPAHKPGPLPSQALQRRQRRPLARVQGPSQVGCRVVCCMLAVICSALKLGLGSAQQALIMGHGRS